MENLNKENFWNEAMEKYPVPTEKFCKWIDGYKKLVLWNEIFDCTVKFHDIPYDMQTGIICRFLMSHNMCSLSTIQALIVANSNNFKAALFNIFSKN